MSAKHYILIFHGSSSVQAKDSSLKLIESLKKNLSVSFSVSYLRNGAPSFLDALENTYNCGYKSICCLPMLLLPGSHTIKEIPEIASLFLKNHTDCNLQILSSLAENQLFIDFLSKLLTQHDKTNTESTAKKL